MKKLLFSFIIVLSINASEQPKYESSIEPQMGGLMLRTWQTKNPLERVSLLIISDSGKQPKFNQVLRRQSDTLAGTQIIHSHQFIFKFFEEAQKKVGNKIDLKAEFMKFQGSIDGDGTFSSPGKNDDEKE